MLADTDLEHIVNTHRKQLINTAMKIVHNRHDAEDIVQNAFILMHEYRNSFYAKSKPLTWATRIVMNASFTFLSKQKRRKELMSQNIYRLDGRVCTKSIRFTDEELDNIFPKKKTRLIWKLLSEGHSKEKICAEISISQSTFYNHRNFIKTTFAAL